MPTTFSLTQEQYESLVSLAQQGVLGPNGTPDQQKAVVLDTALRSIELANGVTRYSLWIQWQNPNTPLPVGTNFPKSWPPNMRYFLQFVSRPITQDDVLSVVAQKCPSAVSVMVTPDPGALLGWTPVADYFVQP